MILLIIKTLKVRRRRERERTRRKRRRRLKKKSKMRRLLKEVNLYILNYYLR